MKLSLKKIFKISLNVTALICMSCQAFEQRAIEEYKARLKATQQTLSIAAAKPMTNMNYVPDEVNYANYHYVGTHNSHVYKRFFTTTYQHETDVYDQLINGVRGIMLDIYKWNESEMNPTLVKTNRVVGLGSAGVNGVIHVMSHAKPGVSAFSQKGFTGWDGGLAIVEYQTYQHELEKVIRFLKEYPTEVVYLNMESYVTDEELSMLTEDLVKYLQYDPLFRPKDLTFEPNKPNQWPTLGWMRLNNKRLIVMGLNGYGAIWPNTIMKSNPWGAINTCADPRPTACNIDELCKAYSSPANATLNYFNHFRSDAITWALWDVRRDNMYDVLKDGVNKCMTKGLFNGQLPCGIFTDRTVESVNSLKADGIKTIFDLVNEWNAQEAAKVGK